MTVCIKTDLDLYVQDYNAVIRCDASRVGNCLIFNGYDKDRFRYFPYGEEPENWDAKVYDTNRAYTSGILVVQKHLVEWSPEMQDWFLDAYSRFGTPPPWAEVAGNGSVLPFA